METKLFNKCEINLGIDTIKIKLRKAISSKKNPNDKLTKNPIDELIKNLKKSFSKSEIFINPKDGYYFVQYKSSKHSLAKISTSGKSSCIIEIFGMCQTITNFKLINHHSLIFSVIGNLKDTEMELEKIDISLDFFYPHNRSFVFDGATIRSESLDILNNQIKFPFLYLTKMPMATIIIPKKYNKRIIKFVFNDKDIKSPTDDKNQTDCYWRWVKPESSYFNRINYSECEEYESSHLQIKINKRKVYNRIMNLFDGAGKFNTDHNYKTDIYIKLGRKNLSIIKYNKFERDAENDRDVQDVYKEIIEKMTDTKEECDDFNFSHTRVEIRLLKPDAKNGVLLDLNSELRYGELLKCIKKEIEKISIFILKPDISTDNYLNLYKNRLKKVSITKPLIPDDFGRLLEISSNEWVNLDNQINFLKSKFINENGNDIDSEIPVFDIKRLLKGKKRSDYPIKVAPKMEGDVILKGGVIEDDVI